MEWMKLIGDAVQLIEERLTQEVSAESVAKELHLSPFYFQKGFAMLCGFTVSEYIRNRRLALAGHELATTDARVIDVALRYGYNSPDSFAKAFTRFHGVTPSAARQSGVLLKSFAPLRIQFALQGGYLMNYRMESKDAFAVLCNAKTFPYEGAKTLVPQFWQEHYASGKGATVMGVYGVNIDQAKSGERFEYLIGDPCAPDCQAPEGFEVRVIPAFTWAVFPCVGALPKALQDVNTRIYSEWLPALREYEFAAGYCVEYYDDPGKYAKGTADESYRCEIWIPVRKK